MKKYHYIIAVLGLMMMTACKKTGGDIQQLPQGPPPQIATIKQTMASNQAYDLTKEFVYDTQNRLKEVKHSGMQSANIIERYSYNGILVQYKQYIGTAETVYTTVDYKLNSDGRTEKAYTPHYNSSSLYEYNSAGYITRVNFVIGASGSGHQIYHYSNGNVLDSISGYFADGTKGYVHVFTYETGKNNTIDNENKGLYILGRSQAAPLKKRILYDYNYPFKEGIRFKYYELDYTYEYDHNNRIKKHTAVQTLHGSNGSSQSYVKEVMEYTYKQ